MSDAGSVVCVAILLLAAAPGTVLGARGADDQAVRPDRRLQAVRATTPIAADGRLDEEAWKTAPVADNFVQTEPHQGDAATEQTEARALYDDEYLYLGVIAFDAEPDQIIVNDLKGDFDDQRADAFGFIVATFRDRRNGFISRSTRGAPSAPTARNPAT